MPLSAEVDGDYLTTFFEVMKVEVSPVSEWATNGVMRVWVGVFGVQMLLLCSEAIHFPSDLNDGNPACLADAPLKIEVRRQYCCGIVDMQSAYSWRGRFEAPAGGAAETGECFRMLTQDLRSFPFQKNPL